MVRIQRLARPNKHSGYKLEKGAKTKVRGVVIVNTNEFPIFIDKYTRKKSHVAKTQRK